MEKLYIVTSTKNIIGMDNIQGPLTTPVNMKFNNVLEMVRRGYEVYQVNPFNHSEKVKVTISNINNISFKISRSAATAQKKLNEEIQEMSKPMVVDVVVKETKKEVDEVIKQKEKTENKNFKQNENKKENKPEVDQEKLNKPDEFSK